MGSKTISKNPVKDKLNLLVSGFGKITKKEHWEFIKMLMYMVEK